MIELIKSLLTPEIVAWLLGIGAGLWGIGKVLKVVSEKGTIITKELGEAFLATSDALSKADKAIEEDGSIDENSIKDVISSGKTAVTEWKDVIVTIKPKKK